VGGSQKKGNYTIFSNTISTNNPGIKGEAFKDKKDPHGLDQKLIDHF